MAKNKTSKRAVYHYYENATEQCKNIINGPATRLQDDQKLMYGFSIGVLSIILIYVSLQLLIPISPYSIIGLIVLLVSLTGISTANKIVTDFCTN